MSNSTTLLQAKKFLDTLIANARDQMQMPMTLAEVLRKLSLGEVAIEDFDAIRKKSYHWLADVTRELFRKGVSLNRSYWNRLYTHHMPLEHLGALAQFNTTSGGLVEAYIYARLAQTAEGLHPIRRSLVSKWEDFSLISFLSSFEDDSRLKRSIGKAYEIVVHALFNAIARRLNATVTISVQVSESGILDDFKDFCRLLLGLDDSKPILEVPARLYRVGGANSRDGGVDLWANFGPAIQVKHVSLKPQLATQVVERVSADHMVIVCNTGESAKIMAVLQSVNLADRVRGIITRADLIRWYKLALGSKHFAEMAEPLFKAFLAEFDDEFPLADPKQIRSFGAGRGYAKLSLQGLWSTALPVERPPKGKKPK